MQRLLLRRHIGDEFLVNKVVNYMLIYCTKMHLGHMDCFNGFFNILKVVVAWAVN